MASDSVSAKTRAEAARAVARVMAGQNLDSALALGDETELTPQNRSLLRAMAYGVVREHSLLAALTARLLDKPLQKAPELHALLLLGVHQLRSMRMPAHAALSETVNAVALLNAAWARGLVNAVLRRYQREARALEDALPSDPAIRFSHPAWLVNTLREQWPAQWQDLLKANNEAGPLTLRVNAKRGTVADYLRRLAAAGLSGRAVDAAVDAVVLDEAAPVEKIPGFSEGDVSVQDAAAQLAVELLDLAAGQRVLDACAAPGGKTAHLLERFECDVLALDVDAERLKRVQENLDRLKLRATLIAGDASRPSTWWDGKPFERILLDAPCSSTGVIRRHPDIKWLRRADDIPRLARAQYEMLNALWSLLAPGGTLLYAVCSVLEAEGPAVIRRFAATQNGVEILPLTVTWGQAVNPGRRIAPGGGFDGFYFAKLRKT